MQFKFICSLCFHYKYSQPDLLHFDSFCKIIFHGSCTWYPSKHLSRLKYFPTCTCLQSWPLAGSWMRLNVIGQFSEILMAVCSTPSSPFRPAPATDTATLLKLLFTEDTDRTKTDKYKTNHWDWPIWRQTDWSGTFSDAVFGGEESLPQ